MIRRTNPRGTAQVIAAVALVCTPLIAHADAGIPLIAVFLPPMWLAHQYPGVQTVRPRARLAGYSDFEPCELPVSRALVLDGIEDIRQCQYPARPAPIDRGLVGGTGVSARDSIYVPVMAVEGQRIFSCE
jgi:hypothetical protein